MDVTPAAQGLVKPNIAPASIGSEHEGKEWSTGTKEKLDVAAEMLCPTCPGCAIWKHYNVEQNTGFDRPRVLQLLCE